MKKGVWLLILVFVIGFPQHASASTIKEENNNIMSQEEIEGLSDDEFDAYINELVATTADYESLQEDLKTVGVDLSDKETSMLGNGLARISFGEISVMSARRGQETFHRLIANVNLFRIFASPGTIDAIAIYFDSSLGTFHSYNVGEGCNLRSGANATSGTVLFNFYDVSVKNSYCSVYVTPKAGKSGKWLNYGADYCHTETESGVTISGSVGVSFGGTGKVQGSIGLTFTPSTKETSWQIADVNAFLIP